MAQERARNLAQALQDAEADVEKVAIEILSTVTEDLPFNERVLAIANARDAWIKATQKGAKKA